jgi:hypothetical protein
LAEFARHLSGRKIEDDDTVELQRLFPSRQIPTHEVPLLRYLYPVETSYIVGERRKQDQFTMIIGLATFLLVTSKRFADHSETLRLLNAVDTDLVEKIQSTLSQAIILLRMKSYLEVKKCACLNVSLICRHETFNGR